MPWEHPNGLPGLQLELPGDRKSDPGGGRGGSWKKTVSRDSPLRIINLRAQLELPGLHKEPRHQNWVTLSGASHASHAI